MYWMKLSCLLLYGLALAGWTGVWSASSAVAIQTFSLAILGAHAIEVLIGFKYVRLYQGKLAVSVLLTLLFGILHLRPLAQQARLRPHVSSASGDTT
jgi:hypothetical protein